MKTKYGFGLIFACLAPLAHPDQVVVARQDSIAYPHGGVVIMVSTLDQFCKPMESLMQSIRDSASREEQRPMIGEYQHQPEKNSQVCNRPRAKVDFIINR
jgi:hypothetical protein